ncbi:MAG: CpsD/CapB family tyrosine-protein kinase [Amphiplicatus sp.]|uniref:CpsD/CapB family tyrosine-protein kinase n=1 Tax=Methylocystis sp. TaxID=1911079 RepID=UPI003D119971
MDHIREAVLRARGARKKTGERPPATTSAGGSPNPVIETRARFERDGAPPDISSFPEFHCDFDGFARRRIISNEQDPVLNSYRVLRTRLLQRMEAEGWRTVAVVSPNSGAGKTVTAINLSIAIGSKAGNRVALVDLDFHRPSIARYLGLSAIPSLLDFFEGAKPLRDVVMRPDLPEMLLLGNERVSRRGAEHLTSPRADELISGCLNEFGARFVVFDISPLLGCDDAIAFLPKVDCVLLIAASGDTKVADLKEARRLLAKTKVVGTVLNKAPDVLGARPYYY